MQKQIEQLYKRGKYRLGWDRKKDGSFRTSNLQIFWYDAEKGRERSASTGTDNLQEAELKLDRYYLKHERGETLCPTCGRPTEGIMSYQLAQAISDYLIDRDSRPSIDALRARLAHVLDFVVQKHLDAITCEQVDASFVEQFRQWSKLQPVITGKHVRERSPGTTEASVRTLAAALNFAFKKKRSLSPAGFTALPPYAVSHTPTYRSDIAELASMFRYCLYPEPLAGKVWSEKMRARQRLHRTALLRFLQLSVATWCRPDAAYGFSLDPDRMQWVADACVIRLNPKNRVQTKKYRAIVPVSDRFIQLFEVGKGHYVPVASVRKAFDLMLTELGLPRERETGQKLIRRSMSQIVQDRIGVDYKAQVALMLGHVRLRTTDVYALTKPEHLGVAFAATCSIIEEIEVLTPGAFLRNDTGDISPPQMLKGV